MASSEALESNSEIFKINLGNNIVITKVIKNNGYEIHIKDEKRDKEEGFSCFREKMEILIILLLDLLEL